MLAFTAADSSFVAVYRYKLETDPRQNKRSTEVPLSSIGLDDRLMARSAEEVCS